MADKCEAIPRTLSCRKRAALNKERVGQGEDLAGSQPGVLSDGVELGILQFPAAVAVSLRQSSHETHAAFIEVACK